MLLMTIKQHWFPAQTFQHQHPSPSKLPQDVTHLIEQNHKERLEEQQHDPNDQVPVNRQFFHQWQWPFQRQDTESKKHRKDLNEGNLDDNGDEGCGTGRRPVSVIWS